MRRPCRHARARRRRWASRLLRRPPCASSAHIVIQEAPHDGNRRPAPVAPSVRVGHRAAHPAARAHRGARVLRRDARGARMGDGPRRLPASFRVLAADLRGVVRDGRGVGDRDAVPVRHELEPLRRGDVERDRRLHGVRGADRVLPRIGVPRRAAVRPPARAAVGARAGGGARRARHAAVVVLDSRREQLDADAERLPVRRRALLSGEHRRGAAEPVVSVPARAYGRRVRRDDRVRRARHGRALSVERARRRRAA